MTAINKTRAAEFAQKKGVSILALVLDPSLSTEFDAAESYVVAALPSNSLVVGAEAFVNAVSDIGTLTLGITEAGTEIMSGIDTSATGDAGAFTGTFDTGTGKSVYLETAAPLTTGEVVIIVEYIEYTKNTGEYTKFTSAT